MNNTYYNGTGEYEIDLANVLWKLLEQWKAILIVCIVMALLVPSAMYAKAMKAHDALLKEQTEMEEQASKPLGERIEERIADVEEAEDVTNIRFILQQQELIDLQKDYLAKSVWINTNPVSQRNIALKYYLQRGDIQDTQMLIDTYNTCMRRNKLMKDLREAMGIDAPLEFVYELISTSGGGVADDNVENVVFTVNVVIPDDNIDASVIADVIDKNLKSINKEITQNLGTHSIRMFNIEDAHYYSQGVTDKRTNISYTINNITNNINAARDRLSEDGKEAYEEITDMRLADVNSSATEGAAVKLGEEAVAPSFSNKYAVLGFILGAFLYAGAYLVLIVLRKNVESPSSVTSFTGARVLGEIYNMAEHKGISKLLHSDRVAKMRCKGRDDAETQMSKAIDSIDAVSEHAGAKEITVFSFKDSSETYESVLDNLAAGLKKKGIKSETEDIEEDVDEKSLLGVKNAILAVSSKTKMDKLAKLAALCRDYDVNLLGSVYTEEL